VRNRPTKGKQGRNQLGSFEPLLSLGSSIIAEPISGLAGLAALPFGADVASNAISGVQDSLTYQPRTEDGQAAMQSLTSALAPVGEAFTGASKFLGDKTYDMTGSPSLAAAAYSLPTLALEAVGLKGARSLNTGKALEFGGIGTQASSIGGKQRGIFAGVRAKNADLKAKSAAQELSTRGVSRDEIWNKTGWFEDVDGMWKFEIDDSGAISGNPKIETNLIGDEVYKYTQLKKAVDHPELYKAYNVGDIEVGLEPSLKSEASYSPSLDSIQIQKRNSKAYIPDKDLQAKAKKILEDGGVSQGRIKEILDARTKGAKVFNDNDKSFLLHEVQHAIQEREGFAKGGSPASFANKTTQSELQNIKSNAMSAYKKGEITIDQFYEIDGMSAQEFQFNQYKRLAGEAEARNVQTRMNMSLAERAEKAPYRTLDIPENELIVRK
jgi:hypothetical protein